MLHTLFLLRHAKSSWDDDGLDDHERPLTPRGERAAAVVGAYLSQRNLRFDALLCSTAVRARRTVERVSVLAPLPEPSFEPTLYLATSEELMDRLRRVPEDMGCVLLVGHDPAIGELARELAGSGDREARDRLARKLPTAGLVELSLGEEPWSKLAAGCARLESFVTPRSLV